MPPTRDELALPHFEDRLWGELDDLYRQRRRDRRVSPPAPDAALDPGSAPARRAPSRRSLLVTIGGVAAAAAVVVAVAVTARPEGGPGADPGPDPVAADVVVAGVLEAIEPSEDAVIHATITRGDGTGSTESWYDEVTAAERYRHLDPEGQPLLDTGWPEPPGVAEPPDPGLRGDPVSDFGQCDPGTRLAMDEEGNLHPCDPGSVPPQPFHDLRAVNHCRQEYVDVSAPLVRHPGWGYLRMYLETGDIVVDGTEEVGGRELLELRNRAGNYVYLVDPETYLPVQERTYPTEGGDPDVTTYERLPRTADSLALLSPPVPEGFTEATVVADCGGMSVHHGPGSGSGSVDADAAQAAAQDAAEVQVTEEGAAEAEAEAQTEAETQTGTGSGGGTGDGG